MIRILAEKGLDNKKSDIEQQPQKIVKDAPSTIPAKRHEKDNLKENKMNDEKTTKDDTGDINAKFSEIGDELSSLGF